MPVNLNKRDPDNVNGAVRLRARAGRAGVLLASVWLISAPAMAQHSASEPATASEETLALLAPKPHSTHNPLLKPSREYRGIAAGDWMFHPTVIVGAVFDDNLVWSTSNKVSAVGVRFRPSLIAVRDAGIHKTRVQAEVDARVYPTLSHNNTINGQAGIEHAWEIERDFSVKARAEYAHKAFHISGGLVSTPAGLTTLATPLQADQLMAGLSAQKAFGKAFVGAALEATKTVYGPLETQAGKFSQDFRNSTMQSGTLRAGYWFAPAAYAFTEASGNLRQYDSSALASKGYRAVAGIGSDRISLFRGEVFGGIQQQFYEHHVVRSATSPVYGGKIFWYPTRTLTVRLVLDQSFTDSSTPTQNNPGGYPQRVTAGQLSINYQFARDLNVSARVGYDRAAYIGVSRRDNAWRAGVTLAYDVYRNLGVVLDYDYTQLVSTAPNASYTRNAVMLSVKYQY